MARMGKPPTMGNYPFCELYSPVRTRRCLGLWKAAAIQPKGGRRLRVGDYRVVFINKGDVVTIVKIGHRKEIYKWRLSMPPGWLWRDSPTSHEPRRGLRPRGAARSEWSRRQALQRNRVFIDAIRAARKLWLAGMEAIFPRGTYWLCRFARIQVADAIAVPIISN